MYALNKYYWRFRGLLEYKYGINSKEDALISFLMDKKIDFTPLFYNSAIPIKELFYFFVIAGNSFDSFSRIPSLFIELKNFNAVCIEDKTVEDLQKLRCVIRNNSITTGVLIRTLDSENNAQWEYIKPQGVQFMIANDCRKNSRSLSAAQLRKIYGGEIVWLKLICDDLPRCEQLLRQRLFKPEQYVPFYFVESDLSGIKDLNLKLINMFYVYKVTRYRMMQYYSRFVNIEFIKNCMKNMETVYNLLIQLKDGANTPSKCFTLLHELNQIDVFIMSQLKEKMGEIQ